MRPWIALVFACLAQAGCSSPPNSPSGPFSVAVQRLDPQPSPPGTRTNSVTPGAVLSPDAIAKLGYAAGIPLGERTRLLINIAAPAGGDPMGNLVLVAGTPPDGVDVSVIDTFTAQDDFVGDVSEASRWSIRAPAATSEDGRWSRWIEVAATGDPRVARLDFTLEWTAPDGSAQQQPFQVALGLVDFEDGPTARLPSGASFNVHCGEAPADPAPIASVADWPAAAAEAVDGEIAELAGALSFDVGGASLDDGTLAALLDDLVPLIAARTGEVEGVRLGRALTKNLALDPFRGLQLTGAVVAQTSALALALMPRDRFAATGGKISWSAPTPLPTVDAPPIDDGGDFAVDTALPAPALTDAGGASIAPDGDGGYTVTPPFRVVVPAGAGFAVRDLATGGASWSPLVGGAPEAGVALRVARRVALSLEVDCAIYWVRDGRVDSAAVLPGGRLGVFVDL